MLPGVSSPTQRAIIKYFVAAALLFLVQVLVGGATAHFRADPGSFYGFDLTTIFPSNILRTCFTPPPTSMSVSVNVSGSKNLSTTQTTWNQNHRINTYNKDAEHEPNSDGSPYSVFHTPASDKAPLYEPT